MATSEGTSSSTQGIPENSYKHLKMEPIELVPEIQFFKSQRNKDIMVYLGYEYLTSHTAKKGVVTWRCRENRSTRCHALIKTSDGKIVQGPTQHCHLSCPQKATVNLVKSAIKQEIETKSDSPRVVMENILKLVNDETKAYMPKMSSMIRMLRRQRSTLPLANPTTVQFDTPEKYNDFILHDSGCDDPDRILVLGDRELILHLNEDEIYGDGTFDKVPNALFQLYTWHAKVGSSYPPCIYFLLPKKDMDTYTRMFEIMKLLIPNLAPKKVFVEFEKTCINATILAFPDTEVKGCFFHLCQSLVQKITTLGLKTEFDINIDVKVTLLSLAALAFVPIDDVKDVYCILADTFPDEERYNEVLTYFFSTYIEGPARRDPHFPIRIWNQYDTALQRLPNSTKSCEIYHNKLNAIFYCSNLTMWLLLDGLQRDIAGHKLALAKELAGCPQKKKKKLENLEDMFTTCVQSYPIMGDKVQYLKQLANLQ